jgi:hypothetical protein
VSTINVAGIQLELRPPPSEALIYSSWLRSYRSVVPKDSHPERWFASHRRVVEDLYPLVRCAISPSAPSTVHGWVCGEPYLLHWVFVPVDLRRMGVGTALVRAVCGDQGILSHLRPKGLAGFAPSFGHDPYALVDAVRRAARMAA